MTYQDAPKFTNHFDALEVGMDATVSHDYPYLIRYK
jgi:hypothetical protein